MLNKFNLSIGELADERGNTKYAIDGVHVTAAETVATDGHCLIRITTVRHESLKEEYQPFTMPAEHAAEIAAAMETAEARNEWNQPKTPFPATLDDGGNGKVELRFSDAAGAQRSFEVPKLEKPFPQWPVVIPSEGEAVTFVDVNLELLIPLLEQVQKFSQGSYMQSVARIRLFGPERQVRIDAENDHGQKLTAVLMPLKPFSDNKDNEPQPASAL